MSTTNSQSQSEDIVIVESSDYAQVVFEDVRETYSNLKPLECTFILNELLQNEQSDDWVGIYKVGFSNCSQFICNQPVNSGTEIEKKILFPVEMLPKEDSEFYQFVYVSNAKQIRGASVPFQFKTGQCTEYSDDEDQDAVIVKFDNNDTMSEIKTKCAELSVANNNYQKIIKENEVMIKGLKDEVASIKLRCFRLTMDNEKLNFTLRNKADSLKNLAENITSLTSDNNNLLTKFNDLTSNNRDLMEKLEERIDQVASLEKQMESVKIDKEDFEGLVSVKESELIQLEKDKDELKRIIEELYLINEQISKLEVQVTERTTELDKIKDELQKNNIIVSEQAEQIQSIIAEKESLLLKIEELSKENGLLLNGQQDIIQELAMSKEKIEAVEQSKEMLRKQLESVSQELEDSKKKIATQTDIAVELTEKLNQNGFEKANHDTIINQLKEEHQEKINQINGSYYVLKVAHNSLETRLRTSEHRRELADKEIETQQKTIEQLKEENEEFKERIRYGAMEYQKIFDKYRFYKNQKFNSDLNVYQTEENQPRRRTHLGSFESKETDSAIQDKTVSQSARASNDDSENTLLDALLGSSFYNGTWNTAKCEQPTQINTTLENQLNEKKTFATPARTTQPKSSDFSDDGLIHGKRNQPETEKTENLAHKLNRCQIGISKEDEELRIENCEVCDFVFPTGTTESERNQHINSHGQQCPVCFLQFRKDYNQNEFEIHVNSHFTN